MKMVFTGFLKLMLPLLACYIGAVLLLQCAVRAHYLSPDGMVPAIVLLAIATTAVFMFAARRLREAGTLPSLDLNAKGPFDPVSLQMRVQFVRVCKVGLAFGIVGTAIASVRAAVHPAELLEVIVCVAGS